MHIINSGPVYWNIAGYVCKDELPELMAFIRKHDVYPQYIDQGEARHVRFGSRGCYFAFQTTRVTEEDRDLLRSLAQGDELFIKGPNGAEWLLESNNWIEICAKTA